MNFCPHCGTRVPETADAYCQKCQQSLVDSPIVQQIKLATDVPLDGDVARLERRLEILEKRIRHAWITGDSLFKRAWAAYWYVIFMALIISMGLIPLAGLFAVIMSALFDPRRR